MKMYYEVPNLDCMDIEELSDFQEYLERSMEGACKALFGKHDVDTDSWAVLLWHYTVFKRSAIRYRLAGDIQSALDRESECEEIYNKLPEVAKW